MDERENRLPRMQRFMNGLKEFGGEVVEIVLLPFTYARALKEGKVPNDSMARIIIGGGAVAYLVPPAIMAAGVVMQNPRIFEIGFLAAAAEVGAVLPTAEYLVTSRMRLGLREAVRNTPSGTMIPGF